MINFLSLFVCFSFTVGLIHVFMLQPGFALSPFVTYSQQSAPGGVWNFPPAGEADFVLLQGGVVYLNITASDCQPANPVPSGRVLRTHHYYSKRPYATFMYGEFDTLKWSAYIGMGNETQGTALTGEASRSLLPCDCWRMMLGLLLGATRKEV